MGQLTEKCVCVCARAVGERAVTEPRPDTHAQDKHRHTCKHTCARVWWHGHEHECLQGPMCASVGAWTCCECASASVATSGPMWN
eukprot:12883959-Alexandrium_andersonii.AAC.1